MVVGIAQLNNFTFLSYNTSYIFISMATVKARIEHLLKEAKEYDPDKRFMAANDLCAELLKDQEPIDSNLVKQVCSVFLAQLDDLSIDVQGNAVRCIKRIVAKIHETQVSEVIGKLGDCLKTGKEEFRDIYATCLKGLITDVPESYANVVCDTIMPILLQCILRKNTNVAEEALEILTDLIKRFPGQLHTTTDRAELISGINALLLNSKSSIKKKAINCIGAVSLILPSSQLQKLVNEIIKSISSRESKKDIYSYVQSLSAISRNVGDKLSNNLQVLINILSGYCDTSGLNINSATIETDYELIETCLNAIECLVRRCAKDILEYIPGIMNLVLHLAVFDPNFSYIEQEDDIDDDWGSDDNDSDYGNPADDSSWKIRRAALNTLEAVIKSRPEVLSNYYTPIVNTLIQRFKEREENVKLDVFKTFSTLIKSILIGDLESIQSEDIPSLLRTRSSADVFQELLPVIILEVSKEFNSKSLKTRYAATTFLLDLSLSFPVALSDSIASIQPGIIKNLEDVSNSQIRINSLNICRRIIRSNNNVSISFFYAVLPQIIRAVRDNYYKVTTEALKLIGNIAKAIPNEVRFVTAVFPLVLEKLSLTDIDQEVKQAAIYSTAAIISASSAHISPRDIAQALELITDRLKNEVTRGSCLKAWTKISQSPNVPIPDPELLKSLCEEFQNLLKKSLRALKLSTLEALFSVSKAYPLSENSAKSLVSNLSNLINENDLHLTSNALATLEILLQKNMNLSEDQVNTIIKSINALAISSLVHGATLNNLCLVYKAVVVYTRYPALQLIHEITSNLNQQRKALEITAQCAAAVCIAGGSQTIEAFLSDCIKKINAVNEHTNFSVLCIGEIGRNNDLSSLKNLTPSLINLFDSKAEDTKICASIALGKIAVGNLEAFLPVIFQEFSTENHRYLLLNSIEEVINYKSERMAPYIGQILPVLFENSERAEENVRNIVAECLGKLISVSPESIISHIIRNLNQGSVFCKITMVSSIKYAVNTKIQLYTEYMEQILPIILECFNISDVNLIKACLISINSIAHNSPSALKQNFSAISTKVFQETILKQELIKKVDLGAFMHVTDEGLPIRKAAYGVIETFIEQLPEKIDANRVLEHIIIGLDDPSDEIQMLCHQLLAKFINWGAGAVIGSLNAIIIPIRKNVEKNHKLLNNKQEVERATDILRSALRTIEKIETQIEVDSSLSFKEFLNYVSGVPELAAILQAIKSQRESLFFI